MCTSYKLQRVLMDLSQSEMARRSGISPRRLRAIERGESKPTDQEKATLIRAFQNAQKQNLRTHETKRARRSLQAIGGPKGTICQIKDTVFRRIT
jgi:transcriptional regulator with XRE-family HTH domain